MRPNPNPTPNPIPLPLPLTLALALTLPTQVWEACPASCSAHGAPRGTPKRNTYTEIEAEIGTIGLSVDGVPVSDLRPAT